MRSLWVAVQREGTSPVKGDRLNGYSFTRCFVGETDGLAGLGRSLSRAMKARVTEALLRRAF